MKQKQQRLRESEIPWELIRKIRAGESNRPERRSDDQRSLTFDDGIGDWIFKSKDSVKQCPVWSPFLFFALVTHQLIGNRAGLITFGWLWRRTFCLQLLGRSCSAYSTSVLLFISYRLIRRLNLFSNKIICNSINCYSFCFPCAD